MRCDTYWVLLRPVAEVAAHGRLAGLSHQTLLVSLRVRASMDGYFLHFPSPLWSKTPRQHWRVCHKRKRNLKAAMDASGSETILNEALRWFWSTLIQYNADSGSVAAFLLLILQPMLHIVFFKGYLLSNVTRETTSFIMTEHNPLLHFYFYCEAFVRKHSQSLRGAETASASLLWFRILKKWERREVKIHNPFSHTGMDKGCFDIRY